MEIIKLTIADVMVDISIKQVGGLCTLLFVERIATRCSFLKEAIILLKAWMTYEASLLGSHAANMATYALYVLVIFLINNFEVDTPLDVFMLFFEYFGGSISSTCNKSASCFDWDQTMISIFGPIRTHNFYDRLKTEFNFDMEKFALYERSNHFLKDSAGSLKTNFKVRQELLFKPEDL